MPTQYLKALPLSLSLLLASTVSLNASAQDAAKLSFKTEKISDTLYMLSGEGGFTGGNVGVSIGEDGVAMIDNGVPQVLDLLRAEVAEITDKPIDYMINTHVHGDHIGNNHAYGEDGAQIISHDNLRVRLLQQKDKDGNGAGKAALPVLTFNDKMTLHINGDAAKIIHFDHAHTDGDAVVYFKNDNVIHTGDIMFNGLFPFIDADNGGSVDGVIKALKGIAELSDANTKIMPGHGPLANRDDVLKTVAMIEDAKQLVGKLIDEGKSDDEILAANPLTKYASFNWAFITTERMTKQVIAGLRN